MPILHSLANLGGTVADSGISILMGILTNTLSDKLNDSQLFKNKSIDAIWYKFYQSFIDSINDAIKSENNSIKKSKIREVKRIIKTYVDNSNYHSFVEALLGRGENEFSTFLSLLKNDKKDSFKLKLAEDIYISYFKNHTFGNLQREDIVSILINVLGQYYKSFLSNLGDNLGQNILLKEIFDSKEQLKSIYQLCREINLNLINKSGEQLTEELFRKISKENLLRYWNDEFSHIRYVSSRKEDALLYAELNSTSKSISFIVGKSGTGKSLICFNFLNRIFTTELVLRVKPHNIENANSIEEIIYNELTSYKPDLKREHSSLFSGILSRKIYVVVDDLNRVNDSGKAIKKILSWRMKSEEETSPFKIICPLWEKTYSGFSKTFPQFLNQYHLFNLSFFDGDDSRTFLNDLFDSISLNVNSNQVNEIAKNLNNDPFLLGLYTNLIIEERSRLLYYSLATVDKFFTKNIEEITTQNDELLYYEIEEVLHNLLKQALLNKSNNIHFKDVSRWFVKDREKLSIIKRIGKNGNIFKIDQVGNIIFRHDRIKDALSVKAIAIFIEENNLDDNIFFERYYSHLIGEAITKREIPTNYLPLLIEKNPIAIIHAVKYLNSCTKIYRNEVLIRLKIWLENSNKYKILQETVSIIFEEMDSEHILYLTESVEKDMTLHMARFKNGDVLSGLECFEYVSEHHNNNVFVPSILDRIRLRHGIKSIKGNGELIDQLKEVIQYNGYKINYKIHAIELAGILFLPDLVKPAIDFWTSTNEENKTHLIAAILYAAIRSYRIEFSYHLKLILDFWKETIDKSKELWNNRTYKFLSNSNLWQKIPASAVKELYSWLELDEEIRSLAFNILRIVDHPKVVELLHNNPSYSNELLKRVMSSYSSNLVESRYEWRRLALEHGNDEYMAMFINAAQREDLDFLRDIHPQYIPNDEMFSMFGKLCWKRLNLNDELLYGFLEPQLENLLKTSSKWTMFFPFIWSDEVKETFITHISKNSIAAIAESTINIPVQDAGEILIECWSFFTKNYNIGEINKYIDSHSIGSADRDYFLERLLRNIVSATLIKSSKGSLPYLNSLIAKINNPNWLFAELGHKYYSLPTNSTFYSWQQNDNRILETRELDFITPFIKYFPNDEYLSSSASTICKITEMALKGKHFEWAIKYCLPLLGVASITSDIVRGHYQIYLSETEGNTRLMNINLKYIYFPTNHNIVSELNYISNEGWIIGYKWIDNLIRRCIDRERLIQIMYEFLNQNTTLNALSIAAKCLELIGKRRDVDMLDEFQHNYKSDNFNEIRNRTQEVVYRNSLV